MARDRVDKAERRRGPKPADPAPITPAPGRPDPPIYLDAVAVAHWDELVEVLDERQVLSHADRHALGQLCYLFSKWIEAERKVKATKGPVITAPNGYKQLNPWQVIATGLMKDMKPYLEMFGLNPRARSKLKLPEPAAPDEKWADFDDEAS